MVGDVHLQGRNTGPRPAMATLAGSGLPLWAGLVVGLLAATLASRLLRGIPFEVGHLDFATFLAVPLLHAVLATTAAILPARRATRIDPPMALRTE